MTLLIEQYQARHHAIPKAAPREILRFLMEQHGLAPKNLWPVVGSKGVTSEILRGKRAVSIATAAKLGDLFHVSPSVFIDWDSALEATAS